jgi:hypothetical protein
LYQYRGEWCIDRWIDRLEQLTQHHLYDTSDFGTDLGTSYDFCEIGEVQTTKEVETPLLLSIGRTAKENKITYRFNTWAELIRNVDLDEGTFSAPNSGAGFAAFTAAYWTEVSRTAFIIREYDALNNETQRYIQISGAADYTAPNKYIQSESFPAVKGDKVAFSYQAAFKTDTGRCWGQIEVKCGSYYLRSDGVWDSFSPFQVAVDFLAADDATEWKSISVESEEIPADGNVELRLLVGYNCAAGNATRYKDIKIDYLPKYGNSNFAKGDFCNYPNTVTTKNPINEDVVISDSLLKVLNGSLLKTSGALETSWQRGANAEEYRFSQLNALGYYQSSYRSKYILEGTFRGTTFIATVPLYPIGFWPIYMFDDLPGKLFTLTSLNDLNWLTGVWQGTFVEVHDTTLDAAIDTVPGNFVYNFIFQ